MTLKTNNFAYSTLGAGITDIATTLTVDTGHGTRFPAVNNGGVDVGEYMYLTLQDASNNFEIVKIVRHDTSSDSFTIGVTGVAASASGRGQETSNGGAVARAWSLGAMVEQRPTVATVEGMVANALASSPALAGTPTSTTAAVDTNTTQIATTAFVVAQAASAAPSALGTQAVGSSTRYARADHVHTDVLPSTTTATTATALDSSTKVATTAFVTTADSVLVPAGIIAPYAGSAAPTGWLLCYGQNVNRTTYAALFAAISTTYGSGDGSTTFGLPDLRGRAVAGVDNMGGSAASRITAAGSGITGTTLGAAGGSETHTLDTSQIPSHTHSGAVGTLTGVSFSGSADKSCYNSSTTTGATGGGLAHNNTQPTLMLNYIIKT